MQLCKTNPETKTNYHTIDVHFDVEHLAGAITAKLDRIWVDLVCKEIKSLLNKIDYVEHQIETDSNVDEGFDEACKTEHERYYQMDGTAKAVFYQYAIRRLIRGVSPSREVAERALFLWNNDHIKNLITQNRSVILPLIFHALEKNTRGHWNQAVQSLTLNVRKIFSDAGQTLFHE
ncbi:serine/threonine protein phosphatase 2A 59 kDa regulatory subunit B' gamma isoform [Tanacetum coccineum]|uniref:Serine/threonine protein phosphatase 2A 59 kDa regulatory subunit B' gamma isoform n=1 Tax=Tanacetum coccineum TaxID=301880 RepID=A0ABQ5HRJ2_9ASTR